MGMYSVYKTSEKSEKEGIILQYDESFRVRVRRAGGSNKEFEKVLAEKTATIKKALEIDAVSNERQREILKEVVAETIVMDWEVKNPKWTGKKTCKAPEWLQGIEGEDGKILPFNYENVLDVFKNINDLFLSIYQDSSKMSLFRELSRKEDSKNS